jgi:hypothetical protein
LCICDVSSCRLPFNRRMIIDTRATIRRFRAVPELTGPLAAEISRPFFRTAAFLFGQRPLDVRTLRSQMNEILGRIGQRAVEFWLNFSQRPGYLLV